MCIWVWILVGDCTRRVVKFTDVSTSDVSVFLNKFREYFLQKFILVVVNVDLFFEYFDCVQLIFDFFRFDEFVGSSDFVGLVEQFKVLRPVFAGF